MATPLYKFLKQNGVSTYVIPGASEDISASFQNDNYDMNFSKFVLLNLDLTKMDLENPVEFNTESLNTITDKGELLVNSFRNYVANYEVVIKESRLNNNTYFYDPNITQTTSERIFWKWLRKSGVIEFEPALPNDEYVDSIEFAVDDNSPDDYFKEYLWKERSSIKFNIIDIVDTGIQKNDPNNSNVLTKEYRVVLGSSSNIKPEDTVTITNDGTINIGFNGVKTFYVSNVDTDSDPSNTSKNNWVYILTNEQLFFNNFAVANLSLKYDRVVQYIGEIASRNNVQMANKSYNEIMAYIPDQNGQTPDVLFRIAFDRNYGPGNQYPILPSQDQPEIVGSELFDSPIITNPSAYPGDQYGYYDLDQKYINSSGLQDRRRGEYFGIMDNNRKNTRVAQAPYTYPEYDGSKLDGLTLDFDPIHYTKMNLPTKKSDNFDEFNAQSFNNQPPKDFEFNVVLWYYDVDDKTVNNAVLADETDAVATSKRTAMNLYAITFLNPVVDDKIETYKKYVSNGKQDGLSYQFQLNLNFNINNDNVVEPYDPSKTYNLFGFDLYNEVMVRLARTNDIFLKLVTNLNTFQTDLNTVKNLLYTQTDVRDINSRIDSLYQLLNLYKNHQIQDSDTIKVRLDESSNPPMLYLDSSDSRFGYTAQLPVSTLYNNTNNTVNDYKISVPPGKDFLLNVINDDTTDVVLDRPLNIVLDRDLDYRQSCVVKIFPKDSLFNKKLNISIITNLVSGIDKKKGYTVIKEIDLPIDKNLNPNIQLDGILKRWQTIPAAGFTPDTVSIKKVSDNYFISIELKSLHISGFKTGDVLLLENFNLISGDKSSDISGQYQIVGDIQNNKMNFLVDLQSFKDLFKKIDDDATASLGISSNEYALDSTYFTQPASFRYNSGYTITITSIDRSSTTLGEKYLIEIEQLRRF